MKKELHPDYKKTVIKCVCGNEIETGSVADNITVEICSHCHPFFTGQQKILDSEGRVERYNKRYGNKYSEFCSYKKTSICGRSFLLINVKNLPQ